MTMISGGKNMTMIKRILVAGGDRRQEYCAKHLSSHYDTGLIGFPVESASGVYDCLILPCIPLDDEGNVPAPSADAPLDTAAVREMLSPEALVIAGRITQPLQEKFQGYRLREYLSREEFQLSNAIPTAEGAVSIALSELPMTLSGSRVLILGMGRIGTALTGILCGFGAEVYAAVRSAKSAAKARISGAKPVCMEDMGGEYQVVFNTVPSIVLKKPQLEKFPQNTLFIELASPPYGIDFAAAEITGHRVIKAPGLPGKTAPMTAGRIIANTAEYIISEEEDSHD